MSFVAAPPAKNAAPVADAIAGDGWWPALSIAVFRDAIEIGTVVTDVRARDALLGGFVSVDTELADWRVQQEDAGAASLALVAGKSNRRIGDEPRLVLLWRRAVHAYAAADLADTHNDISATGDGRDRGDERAAGASEHLRNATLAVRDILGRRRSRVKLL